jgi:hypothetical protein
MLYLLALLLQLCTRIIDRLCQLHVTLLHSAPDEMSLATQGMPLEALQ